MLDLIWGYLLIFNILFSVNTGFFLGNFKIDNIKSVIVAFALGVGLFIVINIGNVFSFNLLNYLSFFFIAVSVILFVVYLKGKSLPVIIILYYLTSFVLASQSDGLSMFNSSLLTVVSIIFIFISFQMSKLLHYAKREYDVIVGEYMSLMAILIFIFALTYNSSRNLDYEMFSSFLILTPTYQLIYVIIGIVVILIIGVYWNDRKTKGG